MAIIGRRACPWCGFQGAHIKRNDDKRAFHHCPECGLMTQARSGAQEKLLLSDMRPDLPAAEIAPPAPAPTASPAPPRRVGLWEQLGGRS